jgi:uncharacterized membrane protein YdcZ (DUF606 family)
MLKFSANIDWGKALVYTLAIVAAWNAMNNIVPAKWYTLIGSILGAIVIFITYILKGGKDDGK